MALEVYINKIKNENCSFFFICEKWKFVPVQVPGTIPAVLLVRLDYNKIK